MSPYIFLIMTINKGLYFFFSQILKPIVQQKLYNFLLLIKTIEGRLLHSEGIVCIVEAQSA